MSMKLEYWEDGGWLVGHLKGIPGVFSQGKTLEELKENIRDAYKMMRENDEPAPLNRKSADIEIEVAV